MNYEINRLISLLQDFSDTYKLYFSLIITNSQRDYEDGYYKKISFEPEAEEIEEAPDDIHWSDDIFLLIEDEEGNNEDDLY